MTLLEYIQSLQDQNLSQEEIFAKAQEWKKNNPQPEVEEEVEETIEQAPVEESNVMFGTKTGGFGSKQFMLDAMNNVTTDFMGNRFVKVSKEEQINNVLSNFKVGSDERTAAYFQLGLKPDDTINKELFEQIKNQDNRTEKEILEDLNEGDIYNTGMPSVDFAAIGKALGNDQQAKEAVAVTFDNLNNVESYIEELKKAEEKGEFEVKVSENPLLDDSMKVAFQVIGAADNIAIGWENAYESSKAMGVDFLSPVLSKFIEEEKLDEYVINQFKKSSKLMSERNDIGSIIKDFDEEGNFQGFTQGTELIGGVINGVGSLIETMLPAALTRGASLLPQIAAPMYIDYNITKAESLYGENPDALKKLKENGETEILIPTALGGLAMGLEYIGLKGIAKQIAGKTGRISPFVNMVFTQSGEGMTEVSQLGVEKFNNSIAKGLSINESLGLAWDSMSSQEAYESFALGFVSSGLVTAPSTFSKAMVTQGENANKVEQYVNTLSQLQIERSSNKNSAFRQAKDLEINEVQNSFKNFIKNSYNLSNILDKKQQNEIVSLIDQKNKNNKNLENLTKSYNKGEMSSQQYGSAKGALVNSNKALNNKIVKIQSDARAEKDLIKKEKIEKGSDIIASELNVPIFRGNTKDVETKLKDLREKGGNVDEKNSTNYGTIVTMEDGSQEIVINQEVAAEDNVVTTDQHEVLHALVNNADDSFKTKLGKDLYQELTNNPDIEVNETITTALENYANDPNYTDAMLMEEVMALTSEGLTSGEIKIKENALTKIGDFIRRALQSLGVNVSFKNGKDVLNFIKDYNRDIVRGKGLSKGVKKAVAGMQEGKTTTQPKASKPASVVTPLAQELIKEDNALLQQALISEIKTGGETRFDTAQAITEKNWGLISPLLNINSQQEMNAAKEVVIDQLMGTFEGSGQGKYSARNTSALEGFSLDPDAGSAPAQVSTYLVKTIRTRKPEIDAAIADRTGRSGQELQQAGGEVVTETETIDTTKLAKKPSETTGLEPETETRITEAVQKVYKGKDVKFSETRNIPKEVADIYGEEFGINPQTITDKTRNFQKTDADGLTKAKQFLLKNAKDDFARLPKTKDDFGKGTFIPKNVRDALYTDGELTGSLKDYMDLIRTKPEKPIYRDRVGQTIRGLLGLHIRNRMLETAQPSQAKRVQSGAKFSKRIKPTVKEIQKLEEAGVDLSVSDIVKSDAIPTISIQKLETDLKNIKDKVYTGVRNLDANYNKNETYEQARDRVVNNFLEKNPKWKNFIKNGMSGGITLGLFPSTEVYRQATSGVSSNNEVIIKKPLIGTTTSSFQGSNKLNPKGLKDFNKNSELQKINELVDFWVDAADYLKTNKKDAWFFGELVNDSRNHTAGPLRSGATYSFYPINPKNNNPNFEVPILIEHGQPNLSANKPLLAASLKGKEYVESLRKPTIASYGQGAIMDARTKDNKSDDDKVNVDYKSTMPAWFYTDVIPAIVDGKLDNIIKKYPGLIGPAARMSASNINQNYYASPIDGKSIPEIFLKRKIPVNLIDGPMVNKAINNGIKNRLSGMSLENVQKQFDIELELAKKEDVQIKETSENIGPEIFKPSMTVEQIKTVMVNSLETKVKASKINPEQKGISVFDFDDTLAKTKEKVIVNLSNGTTKKISASEFAIQADQLTEGGATFDFSNFDKVSKGTAEGPLADLARKRQGKFGSKDIFVLTARPQQSASSIQTFLKSIGINIPLKNITGLEDGSPQAKADWVLNKTAEGYNDFYFADDSFANVAGVKAVLDAVDIKNKVQQAKASKRRNLDKDFNRQLEQVTGKEAFKKYSDARGRLEGQQKDKGAFKRFIKQFTITPSAEDFMGLMYAFMGKGTQGNAHAKFIKENLIDPYNKAEQELISAQVSVANDFAELKKQFPNLKSKRGKNPLLEEIGVGPYTKSQAIRVYMWNKQGMDIPGMSQRDVNDLVKAVEADNELNVFADEVALIQKGEQYPAPTQNWLAGNIASDIMQGLKTGFRKKLMAEFNENADIIFSKENLNKIEAIYGSKFREALEDSLRRMKTGSNRPVFVGGGARIVNEMLDWLNASVGAVMFFNMRSGLLQLISNVNFINWGDNNIYDAAKAFVSKDYFPTVLKLINSDYLINRRDGLKINVNEAELTDAGRKGGVKGMINYLLDKGFAITRIMDSVAIATGGATFFINRKKSLQNRVNKDTGKLYTEAEAEQQAFDDFYAIAEETQQSSNPSKISAQQASFAGRIILSFQNVTMQYNRKTKKSIQDLYNRRTKPGMTQRESDLSNLSSIIYYVGVQNLIFNAMQQALFGLAFDDEPDEEEKDKAANIVNGMADSLLFGLGFGGAIISTVKNVLMRIASESEKKTTQYRDAVWNVFDISPVLDSKVRKLRTAAKTFDWNMKEIKKRGWSIDNPAYLAVAQIISATTNLPIDRALQKLNNLRQATDEETKTWQRVALALGWSGWNFGLPYWGRQSTIDKEAKDEEKVKEKFKEDVRKAKVMGFTKRVPFTGPKSGKPSGKLGVDYVAIERYDGLIQYYKKP